MGPVLRRNSNDCDSLRVLTEGVKTRLREPRRSTAHEKIFHLDIIKTEGMRMNRTELAAFYEVSLPTIDNWTRNGCPYVRKGRNYDFDPAVVGKWLRARRDEDQPSSATERLKLAKAIKAEMENKILAGEYILRSTVSDELVKRVYAIKSDLKALERRLTKWPEAKEVYKKGVAAMMRTYSRSTGVFKNPKSQSMRSNP